MKEIIRDSEGSSTPQHCRLARNQSPLLVQQRPTIAPCATVISMNHHGIEVDQ